MQWEQIAGFDDYEISDTGKVRSSKGQTPIILKERYTHDGYVWYILTRNGKGFSKRAHRLVAEAFIDNLGNKPTVNHIDGNKRNNNVSNLEWATREEQMRHAYKHNLKQPMRGVQQPRHKLTVDQVREIRSVYKGHSPIFGMKALARRFGVSESVIDQCVYRRTYTDVV